MGNFKFNIGDTVKVINYGQLIRFNKLDENAVKLSDETGIAYKEDENYIWRDINSKYVGKEVVITKRKMTRKEQKYSTSLFSWADESQLKLVEAKKARPNIRIQTVLHEPSFIQEFWMQKGHANPVKISKQKWFKLYDANAEILNPITKKDEK
jgi:hypothetical protein